MRRLGIDLLNAARRYARKRLRDRRGFFMVTPTICLALAANLSLRISLGPTLLQLILGCVIIPVVFGYLNGEINDRWNKLRARMPTTTPRNARFLILLLMRGAAGDALLGDLEERFHQIARDPDLGSRRARFWYWFQVIVSLCPLAWAFAKRFTGLAAAYEAILKVLK